MYHNSAVYIPQIILFLGSHEHQLKEVSTLLRHTADPVAADLIQSLTDLVSSLNRNPLFWESIQPTVRQTLIVRSALEKNWFIYLFIHYCLAELPVFGLRQHGESSSSASNPQVHNRWNQHGKCRGTAVVRREIAKWRAEVAGQQVNCDKQHLCAKFR